MVMRKGQFMKTSVLMSVCNGEKYLLPQLESIKNQTINPDEVIFVDDCSTDNSISIITNFINENKLESVWKIYRNESNKGWKRNFMEGIEYTSGDIIFFSDQDDVWLKQKIEVYCKVLSDVSIDVLISPYIEWFGGEISIPEMNCKYDKVRLNGSWDNFNITGSGCTMAFRRKYYASIKEYYVDNWAHDDFFRKMAQIEGRLGVLDSPSILRRFHGDNVTLKKRTYESSKKDLEAGKKSIDMIEKYIQKINDINLKNENRVFLNKIKRGYKNRLLYFKTGKIRYLLKTVLLNREQYFRLRQIPGDFLLVKKR